MIGDVRHGKAGILEQARGADEASAGEILFRRGQFRSEEAAHERARNNIETAREHSDGADIRRREEQGLEKAPAVGRNSSEIEGELRQGLALNVFAARREEIVPKFSPAFCFANVDEL